MSLAGFNVKQRLNEIFSEYLQDGISFSELKNLLISKKAVQAVHAKIEEEIKTVGMQDYQASVIELESLAYNAQYEEDSIESQTDTTRAIQDNVKASELENAALHFNTSRQTLRTQLEALTSSHNTHMHTQGSVTHGHPSTIQTDPHVHAHGERTQNDSHVHEHHTQTPTPETLRSQLRNVENELHKIGQELRGIQNRIGERASRESARNLRIAARNAYLAKTAPVYDTLSISRQQELQIMVKNANQHSNQASLYVVQLASSYNYPILLEQFEPYLERSKRNSSEIPALKQIYTQIKAHLAFEARASVENKNYLNSKQEAANKSKELEEANSKLQDLEGANPLLVQRNTLLSQENTKLHLKHEANMYQAKTYLRSASKLGGLSLLLSIPLALTLVGVIPYFMGPVLLLSILAFPSAILLTAAIGIGIIAAVYGFKAYLNNVSVGNNLKLIAGNSQQAATNNREAEQLKTITIPSLQQQIPKLESRTATHLQQKNQLDTDARNALQIASEIVPVSVTAYSVFSGSDTETVHQHPAQIGQDQAAPSAPPEEDGVNRPVFP